MMVICNKKIKHTLRLFSLYMVQWLYSPDKSRADISPRLFQGYWATAYLPVAYC